ncbi:MULTISPECIES: spore germination protein [unclassified Bacillus (in: firmicutes)]|uniref:spore germination protein n=1 Tax=unclassified Bacillus (in: firmicutes) TaxID=185979 RepID=UPI001596D5D6|nr:MULTISPECIES: spore germination protein [unclassified Bacillus (in: firmicutes)]
MNNLEQSTISVSLDKNIQYLKEKFNFSSDLKIRQFTVNDEIIRDSVIIYLDGITNTQNIQDNILTPLLRIIKFESIDAIISRHLSIVDVIKITTFDEILAGLTKGKSLVLIDGYPEGILADTSDWQMRSINEPDTQRSIKGSLVGFNEQIKVNVNLLRNMVQSHKLSVENLQVGNETKTDVAIIYMDGYVDQTVLDETRKKIKEIDVTYLLEARVIEDALEGKKTLFPLVFTCERPDVAVSALYEGRVAVLVNGIPYTLIVPTLFLHYFHQPDEYNSKSGRYGNRFLRFFSWFFSIILLGMYITIVRFHHEWVPDHFAKIFFEKSDTLLPAILEIIFVMIIFQLLTEASLRIPKSTVIIVSLIGAIVIGQTAVTAKIIHSITLIIVGINFLSSIAIAAGGLYGSVLTLRITFLFLGFFFGLKGIIIGLVILLIYMASLKSLGVPYLAPFIPFRPKEMKDAFIRGDLRKLINSKHTYPHKKN